MFVEPNRIKTPTFTASYGGTLHLWAVQENMMEIAAISSGTQILLMKKQ